MIPSWLAKERSWMDMVMYVAHPTRLRDKGDAIEEYAYKMGFAPVNPFGCGKYEFFEGGRMGRAKTLDFGLSVQRRLCGHTGVFGISDGVLGEVEDRLKWDKEKRIWIYYDAGFDPRWDSEYERLSKIRGDLFSVLRGNNTLIALVGPSAVGKTFWIERLKQGFGKKIERVRNVTTRKPRDGNDEKYYHVVDRQQFKKGIEIRSFLEHDEYLGNYYGSSIAEIRRVLRSANGIFAMTPSGAAELYKRRFEINVRFILLVPAGDSVLKKNLERRGIFDEEKQAPYISKAKDFILPSSIPHIFVPVTGTESDREKIFNAVDTIIRK